jgi:hypothetical protein
MSTIKIRSLTWRKKITKDKRKAVGPKDPAAYMRIMGVGWE